MAYELLQKRGVYKELGEQWIARFLARQPELKSKYVNPIKKECILATNPAILQHYFEFYKSTKEQYDIDDENKWNMDEKGVAMGVIGKTKLIIPKRDIPQYMAVCGNQEWVTLIEFIGVSYTLFAQLHPFYVSWWYRDDDGNDCVVFIIQRQRGFTKNLLLHTGDDFGDDSEMRAVIEGPYGTELKLDSYGTVLLFATGIGIAGQLPYVEKLLEGYHNCEVKTRRIALFWEVESELQTAWVADRMQQLLKEQDTGRILDISLFVRGKFLSAETRRGNYEQIGERIDITYDGIDGENVSAEELIKPEIKDQKGLTVVSLCTNDETGDKIREIVRGMLDETIHLKELDFRPMAGEKVSVLRDMFRRSKGNIGTV
ncbi:HTH CenpB-type DNA-binding domain [Lasallia pustulata]|uniref:HTH CenpB-type DNA-binding domain n=1 Tax=Lasallia pustulata TaxID=136370 RepID=A0A1W5D2M4_9LECA|nr:HTH CenpB-type DNA-binding domain [Lasallia pustulata]